MSVVAITAALEKALAAIEPVLDIAYRNESFTPDPGEAYQRVTVDFGEPNNYGLDGEFQEVGFAQVLFVYPRGVGWGAAMARAQALREAFPANRRITVPGGYVKVARTPSIAAPLDDADGFRVPVRIYFTAN